MGKATYTFPDGRTATIEFETQAQLDEAITQLDGMVQKPKTPETSVADEMSGGEKLLVGFGRGFTDVGEGVQQAALEASESLRESPVGGLARLAGAATRFTPVGAAMNLFTQQQGDPEKFKQQAQAERKIYDEGLGDSGLATTGRIGGNILPALAIPGGQTQALTTLGRIGSVAAREGAIGALLGGFEFADSPEDRMRNVAMGGLFDAGAGGLLRGLGEGARGAGRAIFGRGTNEAASEVSRLADEADVPLSIGDTFGGNSARFEQNVLDRLPGIGTRRFRGAQGEAFERAAKRGIGRTIGGRGVEDVGETVVQSLQRVASQNESAVGKIFDRVRDLSARTNAPVSMNKVQETAARQIKRLSQNPESRISDAVLSRLQQFTESPPRTFEQARLLRSEILDDIRTLNRGTDNALKSREKAAMSAIADAIDDDMTRWAKGQGGSIERLWREGNKKFKELVVPLRENKQLARTVAGDVDAGEVLAKFIRQDTRLVDRSGRARELTDFLDQGGKKAAQFGVLSDAFERSFQGNKFLPSKFANELDKFSTANKGVFNESQLRQLRGLTKLMEAGESVSRHNANPLNGSSLFEFAAGTAGLGGAALASQFEMGGEVALAGGATFGLSLLLTSQRGRRVLAEIAARNLNKMDDAGKQRLAKKVGDALADTIKRAPTRFAATQTEVLQSENQEPARTEGTAPLR